jgi:hypothetical protein
VGCEAIWFCKWVAEFTRNLTETIILKFIARASSYINFFTMTRYGGNRLSFIEVLDPHKVRIRPVACRCGSKLLSSTVCSVESNAKFGVNPFCSYSGE